MSRRFRNLFGYAVNCIHRYRVRTAVILTCLVAASAVFSAVTFMRDGLVQEGALSLKYSPDITVQGIQGGRQTYTDTINIGYIQEAPGVKAVVPRIWGYGNIGNFLVVIVGIDQEYVSTDPSIVYPLEAGAFLEPQDGGYVVIGKGVATLLGAKVGNVLTILTESVEIRSYVVKGIFNSQSGIYDADMILMNIDAARSFFNMPEDKVTDIAVYTTSGVDVNIVAREISDFPNMRIVTKEVLLKAQETTYGARSGFFSVLWYIILIAVAIVAFNQTVVVGHESKFEVGLLKSLGFATSDIIKIRLMESALLGVLAGSIGIAAGVIYDVILNAPVLKDFMLGWATLYPGFPVPVFISFQTVFLIYVITVVPLLFATVIPSWLNATVDPDLAMRGAGA